MQKTDTTILIKSFHFSESKCWVGGLVNFVQNMHLYYSNDIDGSFQIEYLKAFKIYLLMPSLPKSRQGCFIKGLKGINSN